MIAIVGLGNPGNEYKNTYHNMGFMVLDELAKNNNITFSKKKYSSLVGEGSISGENVVLLKPMTFMNNSGESVLKLIKKTKLDIRKLIVVYDDIDLPVGDIRIREKGSAGSHNGMKSIIARINQTDFPRVRIGIGDSYKDLATYVLSKIKKQHAEALKQSIINGVNLIEKFIDADCVVSNIKN